jgi:quercetin dioxygenase-like cupin family protein
MKYRWELMVVVGAFALVGGSALVRASQGLQGKAFGALLPENVPWAPFASFPPSVRLAVLVGDTSTTSPYVVRVKVPDGVKLMPHRHPEDRIYTVMSGIFYIGIGETFEPEKLKAYPPGSVVVLPGNTPHFHWAKSGEYVTQVTANGPLGIEYVNPKDDPRRGGL